MEFQLSYFVSKKMMLWKCCTQYISKYGKISSGHMTGKGQFSFQSQRKAMPKNAQTTTQLYSSHTSKVKSLSRVRLFATPLTDYSLPGSSIHGIFQARILEWVAISFSRRSSRPRDWTRVSRIAGRQFTVWAPREVHTSKVKSTILPARLQQHVNRELPDVQAGFRKGRGTRDQIANIHWITEKQENSRKTSTSALSTMLRP